MSTQQNARSRFFHRAYDFLESQVLGPNNGGS